MNKIYLAISKLSEKFRTMSYGITKDKEQIDDAVQELCLYFMQMNPETLRNYTLWCSSFKTCFNKSEKSFLL